MEINNNFDAPFGPLPALRLQYVPRWVIVNMDRKQSVAEHSFNVALIVKYIYEAKFKGSYNVEVMNSMMIEALFHDGDEIYTGDIPSPAKEHIHYDTASLIKLADMIESYRHAMLHCRDTKAIKTFVTVKLYQKITDFAVAICIGYEIIKPLLDEVK